MTSQKKRNPESGQAFEVSAESSCRPDTTPNNLTPFRSGLAQLQEELSSAPQQKTVLEFIAEKPGVLTWEIAQSCYVLNVPDAAALINKKARRHGVRIVNYLPETRPQTLSGRRSQVHAWRVVEVSP